MYQDLQHFKDEFLNAYHNINDFPRPHTRTVKEFHASACWDIYIKTRDNALFPFQLIGRLGNLGPTEAANFYTASVSSRLPEAGAILTSPIWSTSLNDSWVLAGIHRGVPFHVASPLTHDNLFRDDEFKITVTGREILLIISHYYTKTRTRHGTAESVFSCPDILRHRASQVTFASFQHTLQRLNTNPLRQIVEQA